MQFTLNKFEVINLIDKAVEYGVAASGQKNALAIQIGQFWLDGYMNGNTNLTEDDKKSLKNTINNYYFFD